MKKLIELVQEELNIAFARAFDGQNVDMEIAVSSQPQFGHYQCNSALKLGKEWKKNPREIAAKIAAALQSRLQSQDNCPIESCNVAGPGFLNLTLDKMFVAKRLQELVIDPRLGVPAPQRKEKVVVEFSSPNTAKELHVGHLRSTIIGDCIARLFEFLGCDVLRLNHVGDWGTQFGMLIAYMRATVPEVISGKAEANLSSLMSWYRAAKQRFDVDAEFKKEAQLYVVKLQGGDEPTLAAWKMICDISRRGYQEIYDLLDVKIEERGESFYNSYLPGVVADLEKRGLIAISDGAKCIYLDGFIGQTGDPLPIIIQKSDGGYNYDTTDMAALRHRIEEEKADRIIMVVDAGQSLHFQMLFAAAIKAGYLDPQHVRAEHVAFGVVLGADGKKFKTRSGDTEKLADLLTEAIERAKSLLKEKLPEASDAELRSMAQVLGIDAVKYADLSGHRIKDYTFSYERMLRFEGNTAPFLLYAYVRMQSIQRKGGKHINDLLRTASVILEHNTELELAVHLLRFGEVIYEVTEELLPHRLSDYLYVLAEKFHGFFRDCPVIGNPLEESRLIICESAKRVLKCGLEILGLKVLERM